MTLKFFLSLTLISGLVDKTGYHWEVRQLNDSTRVEMHFKGDSILAVSKWKIK